MLNEYGSCAAPLGWTVSEAPLGNSGCTNPSLATPHLAPAVEMEYCTQGSNGVLARALCGR